MRLFIAINIPAEEKDKIHRATAVLREQGYPVRWVEPHLYHVTLKFLGEVRQALLEPVRGVLQKVASATPVFSMDIGGFGAFPTVRRPRVLWVGVDPSPILRCLKQDLEWGLSEHGFERETRAFHPHFTVGRVMAEHGAGAFRGLDELVTRLDYHSRVAVGSVDLMESHLSAHGPRYEILASFPLQGGQSKGA